MDQYMCVCVCITNSDYEGESLTEYIFIEI
jgi:hypothetical protein